VDWPTPDDAPVIKTVIRSEPAAFIRPPHCL